MHAQRTPYYERERGARLSTACALEGNVTCCQRQLVEVDDLCVALARHAVPPLRAVACAAMQRETGRGRSQLLSNNCQ
jgi:hypothetical protein